MHHDIECLEAVESGSWLHTHPQLSYSTHQALRSSCATHLVQEQQQRIVQELNGNCDTLALSARHSSYCSPVRYAAYNRVPSCVQPEFRYDRIDLNTNQAAAVLLQAGAADTFVRFSAELTDLSNLTQQSQATATVALCGGGVRSRPAA